MSTPSLKDVALTSTIATAATTAAAFLLGQSEAPRAAAPLNATSHILWGEEAKGQTQLDAKYTLTGAALNAGAMVAWSAVHAALFPKKTGLLGALAGGAAVSAMAYVTDYYLVPKRLTPGFEAHLSPRGMATMYGVLAGSLALGALAREE
jgi:hypothetical protein